MSVVIKAYVGVRMYSILKYSVTITDNRLNKAENFGKFALVRQDGKG